MTSMASYEVLTSAPSSVLDGWSVVENEGGTAVNATSDRLQAEVALDHPVVAFDASELRAVLSVVAPKEQSDQRAPLHLVAVLDKSSLVLLRVMVLFHIPSTLLRCILSTFVNFP